MNYTRHSDRNAGRDAPAAPKLSPELSAQDAARSARDFSDAQAKDADSQPEKSGARTPTPPHQHMHVPSTRNSPVPNTPVQNTPPVAVAPHRASPRVLLPALTLLVLLLFFLLLGIGPSAIDPLTLFADWARGADTLATLIFVEIRLPRALLAMTVGAVLGMSGAAMQGLLRNPLAEPGLLGVSGSAALGAVLALYYGLGAISWLMLPLFGMLGAGASVLLILLLAGRHASVSALLLAGVAVSAMSSSGIALALNFAPNPFAMSEMVYWLLGSFANRTLQEFLLALPFMAVGLLLLWSRARFLSALTLGEETAQSLGFEVTRERLLVIFATALAVGAAVAVSGAIGFVGLVVPHLMRPLVGHEPGRLLPVSALAGAALMLLADICVQLLSPQQELKVGVITALVGGPFFLALILRLRRRLP